MNTPTNPDTELANARAHRSKAFVLAVSGALVLAIAGYSAWWMVVADQLLTGIDRWRVERADEGVAATWANAETSGFPNDIVITITEPEIRVPGAWSWQGSELVLSVSPLSLDAVAFRADGDHLIEDLRGPDALRYDVAAEALRGTARGSQDAGAVALDVENMTVREDGREIGLIRSLAVALDRPAQPATPDPGALVPPVAFDLVVDLVYEDKTIAVAWFEAGATQQTDFRVIVRGDVALPLTRRGLEPWRDAGGVLELVSLTARVGPLHLSGDGTFSLDHTLQPVGALTLNAKGYGAVIDLLAERRLLAVNNVGTLKTFLDMFAKVDGTDGLRVLSTAISLQDGKVFLGPFELGRLPTVEWPD